MPPSSSSVLLPPGSIPGAWVTAPLLQTHCVVVAEEQKEELFSVSVEIHLLTNNGGRTIKSS
jgi:hypothetical protein